MKKVMLSTFAATVLLAGSAFAQNQKAAANAPKSATATVSTQEAAKPAEKKETKATNKKEAKATEPAKKATK